MTNLQLEDRGTSISSILKSDRRSIVRNPSLNEVSILTSLGLAGRLLDMHNTLRFV